MSRTPRLTLIGMYEYEPQLFSGLALPDGIDKDIFISSLLLSDGERPTAYPSVPFMRQAITLWSRKWYSAFDRINAALTDDYNPLHNYDRTEEYDDTVNREVNGTENGNSGGTTQMGVVGTDDTENFVSAMNDSDYQPDNKSSNSTGTNSTTTSSDTVSKAAHETESEAMHHAAHLFGNIGVTTSQAMLLEEINLRTMQNIYDIIAAVFSRELLLYIY